MLAPYFDRPTLQLTNIFVPLLSTIRVLTLSLDSQFAVIRPAGPAPTMSTSTLEVAILVQNLVSRCKSSSDWTRQSVIDDDFASEPLDVGQTFDEVELGI